MVKIPDAFGYVMLVLGLSWFMNFYLAFMVMGARKKYKVEYPALYADASIKDHEKFNCVQRAHQNTLENFASVQILMIVNGLVFPEASAILGLIWVFARVAYGYGYANHGPSGRTFGAILSHAGDFPLILMTFYSGARMAKLL